MSWRVISLPWAEADAVRRLRHAVFVAEQGVPEDLEWDGEDAAAVHFLATGPGGEAVGTARLLPGGHIGRMAVAGPHRGRGVGRALLAAALAAARAQGLRRVHLNAQTGARGFYEKSGFRAVGGEFLDAGIPHLRMERELDEA